MFLREVVIIYINDLYKDVVCFLVVSCQGCWDEEKKITYMDFVHFLEVGRV